MSESNPGTPSAAQLAAERAKQRYSTFWPFSIVLLTLIFSTVRDEVTLYRHTAQIYSEDAQAAEALKRAGEQSAFIDSIKTDLEKLAVSDAGAARILADFFPPPPSNSSPPPLPPTPSPAKLATPIGPTFAPFTTQQKSSTSSGGASFAPFTSSKSSNLSEDTSFSPFTSPQKSATTNAAPKIQPTPSPTPTPKPWPE